MSRLSQKITSRLLLIVAIFVPSLLAVSITGIHGLQQSANWAKIYGDHLKTLQITVDLSRRLDQVYLTADALARATDAGDRHRLEARLYATELPALEVALAHVREAHAGDAPDELIDVGRFVTRWASARTTVLDPLVAAALSSAGDPASVAVVLDPLVSTVGQLVAREQSDAAGARDAARDAYEESRTLILRITGIAIVAGLVTALVLIRRVVPRALAPEEDRVEFGEVMPLAEDERDAQDLLRRHLERVVRGSRTVVLRRNNSANRLEAATDMAADSPLALGLEGAEPRACVAIRTARAHMQSAGRELLLSCRVCGECPGSTLCTPLTVGGAVIGSVLVSHDHVLHADEERIVRESVSQAAPVLANLRNLAVAEFRAATDSLTGLPNRRALTDASRRMLAHASRTLTPLALLSLDLDHFKQVNDQYGHAAGDEVLAALGATLNAVLRANDFAGRYGGEEFFVLLSETTLDGALEVAAKLHAAIGAMTVPSVPRRVTASIGVALFPDHAGEVESLERAADRALYAAKSNGRDRTEVFASAVPVHVSEAVPAGVWLDGEL
jgi:diguanylate cyclase (GGDEF)-like protein